MSRNLDRQINYIEFNVADIARSKAFYGQAFGWTFTDFGPEYCEFSDGTLSGGFNAMDPVRADGGPLVILYGDDLETLAKAVVAAGGVISRPAYPFPGGRRFHFTDPDGYELAIWSTD